MDVGVEAKGRHGISVTPSCCAGVRCRGPIRPRCVSVCSLLLLTLKTIPKKKKKKKNPTATSPGGFKIQPSQVDLSLVLSVIAKVVEMQGCWGTSKVSNVSGEALHNFWSWGRVALSNALGVVLVVCLVEG